jgi:ABC-type lipoprotein export system ATPase subunit
MQSWSFSKHLNAEGMTIVMVTHSHRCSANVHRILTVADGRMLAEMPQVSNA